MSDEILEESEQPAEGQPEAQPETPVTEVSTEDVLKAMEAAGPVYIGNIGEGANADWIKMVDGGRRQRADLASHHAIMARYYDAQGDAVQAEHERNLASILMGEDPTPPAPAVKDEGWGEEDDGWGAEEENALPPADLEDDW